ncbi:MAG: hypothetical protein C0609_05065, partial [Deltaproteobacteria bacterium]
MPKLRYASKIFERASSLEEMLVSSSLKPLDAALGEHQRARRMGKNDRNLLGMALYSASRSRNAIMEVIGADFPPGRLLTIGFLDATGELGSEVLDAFTPAEELVDILDKVNAKRHIWMQNIYGEWGEDLVSCTDETVDSICGLFSIPNVFIESGPWRKVNEAAGELVRGKDRQNIHLRCKRASGASEALMSELNQMDKGYWRSAYSESCIIAESPLNIRNFESFRLGMVEVQDEGSQLLIEAAAPFIKGKVLDLCAGGGGKSLAMSDLAPDTDIYAYDIDLRRLNGIYSRIRRAAAKNIKTLSSFDEVMSAAPYDFIPIDAP